MAAKKKAAASAGGLSVYEMAGTQGKQKVALNLADADAVVSYGDKRFGVFVGGVRHEIVSDESLDDLLAGAGTVEE